MERIPPEIIGRAIQEPEFRAQLMGDPEGTASAAGYELQPDQVAAIRGLDPAAVERAVEALTDDDFAKYG